LTGQEGTLSDNDVDKIIKSYREALHAFVNGDPEPVTSLFSTRDDVTLANPLRPPQRGRADVENTIRAAAANFHSGSIHFEEVSRVITPDLSFVVQLEHTEGMLAGRDGVVRSSLRATMIFRPEAGGWKVVHRHADPITTERSITSILAN
jgi:ketosteroid isomerase-like protein